MAIKGSNSHGEDSHRKVRQVLDVILKYADGLINDRRKSQPMACRWCEDGRLVINDARVNTILQQVNLNQTSGLLVAEDVKRSFGDLEALGILTDQRGAKKQGSTVWRFDLKFDHRERQAVLAEFDRLWKAKWTGRPSVIRPVEVVRSGLAPGAPMPQVRLPENYVERPSALSAVKNLLLETEQTRRVTTIAGLGGLGKSVLAMAIVQDEDVRSQFEDGILWVTLGQQPDLLREIGEWIRKLDSSYPNSPATTLEASSRHLQSLMSDKRMLLVVDDLWNAEHLATFQVGGPACQVLVTTREAMVEGTEYSLALMTETEAIALVRGKLRQQWQEEQADDVKQFARVVGYLPLALDLSANLARRGMLWRDLQTEFEDERRVAALELLDSSEAWEQLSEQQQRNYSLTACFNLSLRRLSLEQRRQFAWLGVLPEDVDFSAPIAEVLWNVRSVQAKKGLLDLRNRSLITTVGESVSGELLYWVHDLMHDTARRLIEKGEVRTETLKGAHGLFLERYRERSRTHSWYGLPNDGYIHRYLTWHLEMGEQINEVHRLIASGEDQNHWFETCEQIEQPRIFVDDVQRGWRLSESRYEQDRTRSIILQCRYALMSTTLKMLLEQLPVEMLAFFVRRKFWSIERTWSYVVQMQDQKKITEAIQALANDLTTSLLVSAVEKAHEIQNEYDRAVALIALAQRDYANWSDALEAVRSLRDDSASTLTVEEIATLSQARSMRDPSAFPLTLNELSILYKAQLIQNKLNRADVLKVLAQTNSEDYAQILEDIKSIQDKNDYAGQLSTIQMSSAEFSQLLQEVKEIQNEDDRTFTLCALGQIPSADCAQILEVTRLIQDQSVYEAVLCDFEQIDTVQFSESTQSTQSSHDDFYSSMTFDEIAAQYDEAKLQDTIQDVIEETDSSQRLEEARSIQDESNRTEVLRDIIRMNSADFSQLLEAARSIQNEYWRAEVLIALAQIDSADFAQLLEVARSLQDESERAEVLSTLVNAAPQHFLPEIYQAALGITRNLTDAATLSHYLSCLPLATLSFNDWQTYLHLLAHRKRAELVQDLITLYPAIHHLGGDDAMKGVVGEMRRVCRQWK